MRLNRQSVEKVGADSKTDKISQHVYQRYYPRFFTNFSGKGCILEIGYGNGESVNFWRNLFPQAHLYILDRDVEMNSDAYTVIKCDQSSVEELEAVREKLKGKDIEVILDDGSHIPEHQLLTFNILFKDLLKEGGCYIIEDIECSYWRYGDCYGYPTRNGLYSKNSLISKLAKLPDWLNREFLAELERKKLQHLLQKEKFNLSTLSTVAGIDFGHNCVALYKCGIGDEKIMEREYISSHNVAPTPGTIINVYFPTVPHIVKVLIYRILRIGIKLRSAFAEIFWT